jgi:hypothetical protein
LIEKLRNIGISQFGINSLFGVTYAVARKLLMFFIHRLSTASTEENVVLKLEVELEDKTDIFNLDEYSIHLLKKLKKNRDL